MDDFDTFEDGDYTDGPMEEGETFGEEEQDSEETSEQTQEEEEVSADSQVSLLDEKEDTGSEEDEKDDEKESSDKNEEDEESDEDSESESESKDDSGEDDGSTEEPVRAIKAFSEGKQYDIPENATIRTKVDGKWEKPTLQELKDNYSGVIAHDRKFSDLGDRVKAQDSKETTYEAEITKLQGHMGNISNLVKGAMAGEVNPSDAMDYLLDLMGADTLQFNKLAMEHQAEQYDMYSQMTESEREAYWTKKENAVLTKKQESLTTNQAAEHTRAELSSKVNSLRETHGISEEAYVSAENDLKAEGFKDLSPENIVQAAQLQPLLAQAEESIEPYLDQLDDEEASELAVDIATRMLGNPDLTLDQVKKLLAEQFEVETIVSKLEKKTGGKKVSKKATSKKVVEFESFDDDY